MIESCTSASKPKDNFPSAAQYSGYELVDARHTTTFALNVKQHSKVAVVVRDLAVTAFTNLDNPVYDRKMVEFEGLDHCCAPDSRVMGGSGLVVYRFHFIQKGETKIQLIARHKGLSTTADHYDSDIVTTINVNVQ